jgi:hypothetical protein
MITAFTFVGGLLDCLVFYFVKDLELYKEPEEPQKAIADSSESTESS